MALGSRTFAALCGRASDVGVFGVVSVADSPPQAGVEFRLGKDYLLGMNGFDRVESHREVTRILDINDQFRPSMRCNLTNGAKSVLAVCKKDLESFLDLFAHNNLSEPD